MNDNGLLLDYYESLDKFGIPATPKDFATVMSAVPSGC